MMEEHGEITFQEGCPVCKELCCCGVNRSINCIRKFHCYKKCPAMKKLGKRGAKLVAQAAALAESNKTPGGKPKETSTVTNSSNVTAGTNVATTSSTVAEATTKTSSVQKEKVTPAEKSDATSAGSTSSENKTISASEDNKTKNKPVVKQGAVV